MDDCKKIVIIIPAFNESGRIGLVVNSIKHVAIGGTVRVVIINDGSDDTTEEEAEAMGAQVISHSINLGYGSSLETGYYYALRENFDIVIQMDGDGQHPADEIPKLLAPVLNGEADFTIGSRYLSGDNTYNTSWIKGFGHKVFSGMYSALTGYTITDPTSGFQCLHRKVVQVFSECRFPDDFPDVDVLLIAHYTGLRVKEVPVRMLGRSGGKSMHSGLKPLYYVIKMLLSIFLVILNRRRWKRYVS